MKTFEQYFTEDIDEAAFEEYQDIQNNYLSPIDFVNELNSKKIAPLIYRSGESLFDVDIQEERLKEFLISNKDYFNEIVDHYIKKINEFKNN